MYNTHIMNNMYGNRTILKANKHLSSTYIYICWSIEKMFNEITVFHLENACLYVSYIKKRKIYIRPLCGKVHNHVRTQSIPILYLCYKSIINHFRTCYFSS